MHKLTPSQIMALVACYFGQRPMEYPDGLYGRAHPKAGTPVWRSKHRAGGAALRVVEALRETGYISEPNRHDPEGMRDEHNALTVKGYEALGALLGKLPVVKTNFPHTEPLPPFDFNVAIKPEDLADRKASRAGYEERYAKWQQEQRAARIERAERQAEANRAKTVDRFRQLFRDYGLFTEHTEKSWSDERILEFAEQAGDAIHL